MKKTVAIWFLGTLLTTTAFATIKPVRLEDSSIVMAATDAESANLVWYVKEARYADRDTTSGTIFWKRETVRAPSKGLFTIDVDLSKAKSGERYCVVVVNHSDGQKYCLYGVVSDGKFVRE